MAREGIAIDILRLARRLARTVLGRELFYCPDLMIRSVRLGNPGAAWRICPVRIDGKSIVYSVGVGEDISFDLEMIRRWGVRVHAFDPTPKSITWFRKQLVPPQFVFHEYGLAGFDGVAQFSPPSDPRHVSHSMVTSSRREESVAGSVYRLQSIARELGHSHIDVLKMDIEGAEYGVLSDVLESGPLPTQLLVEFHHRWLELGLEKTKRAVAALRSKGYRLFYISAPGEEFGFVLDSQVRSVKPA